MIEILKQAGLDDQSAQKAAESFPALIKDKYVPVARINELNAEIRGLRAQLTERDAQLAALQKTAADNTALQGEIERLMGENTAAQAAFDEEMASFKLNTALDRALEKAHAVDGDLVRAKLDESRLRLTEDGGLEGLEEQLTAIQKQFGFLFYTETPILTGVTPASTASEPTADPFLQGFEGI